MKLPSLFPVSFFAGGILLSIELKKFALLGPRTLILAALLLLGYSRNKIQSRKREKRKRCFRMGMAGRQGFEPRYADPETAVLPLDDLPTTITHIVTLPG